MRRAIALLPVLGLALLAAACHGRSRCSPCHDPCAPAASVRTPTGAEAAAPAPAGAVAAVPYNATCPVMLGNAVDPSITTVWQGKVVGFCSETCRARFLKNPEKYAKNLP